jgi:hypothetical protein
MRGFLMVQIFVYYGATIYYELESYKDGNWFAFDSKVMLTLLVANSFVIIYLQLKGERNAKTNNIKSKD